ncbi:YwqJ-related putative deaminase [Streptomyces sp. SAJ15]|uniref:WXG100-like domain-containing protein n=1 Tax=Streptomyces sp. SAJ15 TaxID=2011095 RepID=UPI00118681D9|nr:YwqJ-related putative deaminase [Streptomyces sp. SAJ15]
MGVVLPDELAMVLDLIGVTWPNVDEDDYRETAKSLQSFAEAVDTGRGDTNTALNRLISTNKGEMATAINAHVNKLNGKHLHNLAEASRLLAGALEGAAYVVEGAKLAAIVQLGILAAEVTAAQIAAPFTLGLSELGALAGVAVTRTVVKRLLKEAGEVAAEQVLAVVTGPVFAALENMATDLVVQVAADAAGIQDGVDLNQTAKAGKEGMQLASADGGGGLVLASAGAPGGLADLEFDDYEHGRFASRVHSHSLHLDEKGSGHLRLGRGHFNRTKGRGDLAQVIENAFEKAIKTIGDSHGQLKKHLGDVGTALDKAGGAQQGQNKKARDSFAGVRKPDVGKDSGGSGGGGGGKGPGGGGGGKGPGGGGNGSNGDDPPNWHGRTARETRHHRLDSVNVNGLSQKEQEDRLRERTDKLIEDSRREIPPEAKGVTDVGKSRRTDGCAGSFLHQGEITSHTSFQKKKISKQLQGEAREEAIRKQTPDVHPALDRLYQDIKDSGVETGKGHGQCAEIALLSDRLHKLDPTGQITDPKEARKLLEGGVMDTRTIDDVFDRETGNKVLSKGDHLPACNSCKHALPALGIRVVK